MEVGYHKASWEICSFSPLGMFPNWRYFPFNFPGQQMQRNRGCTLDGGGRVVRERHQLSPPWWVFSNSPVKALLKSRLVGNCRKAQTSFFWRCPPPLLCFPKNYWWLKPVIWPDSACSASGEKGNGVPAAGDSAPTPAHCTSKASVVAGINSSFLLIADSYSIYHNLFIHSPVAALLGCFQILAITDVSFCDHLCKFVWTCAFYFFFPLGKISSSGVAGL